MRPPSDMPRRRRLRLPAGRRRILLIIVLVAAFFLATSLRTIARFYTDYLWFQSLDLTSVWRGVLGTKVMLAAVFTLGFFALMWSNLLIAERLSGRTIRFGGSSEDELVLKYRELVGRRAALVRGTTAALIALAAGGGTASQWNNWILLRNHVEFGEKDATFGKDIGFYVFQLPFLRFAVGWLFSALVVVTVVTVVAHYLNGGIRLQATQDRVGPAVKAHVSVLLAALALVRAGQYWLDRYELVFSGRGPVNGAAYTDVNVQLRAIDLLVLISIFATILFLVNIRRRGWVLPAMAVGIWALVAVLAGEAVPALVQRFRVDGERSALEQPYVENNIEATRAAMGLDGVDERPFDADYELTGADLIDNEQTVRNIRLWDPSQMQRGFENLQSILGFLDVPDVDVDRYTVDGQSQQVMVAPRNVDDGSLPAGSSGWEESRLVYTYGYGMIMAPANAKTGQGDPDFTVRDIPITSDAGFPEVTEPRMYFGEDLSGYKIIDTDRAEIEVEEAEEVQDAEGDAAWGDEAPDASTRGYTGRDGVPLDSFVRRAAFALRFGEIEPVTSGSIRSSSRVLMIRDVRERVQTLAPFLAFDADPYPVVVDGEILYVIDAYTTTDRYPNAQRSSFDDDLPGNSGLRGRSFNYARNSVKAVVDAYEGTVTLYVTDDADPLVRAYEQAFPDLFAPVADAPAGLADHFRYPEDLFKVQTGFWGRYHITDPDAFLYTEGLRWTVAETAATTDDTPATTTSSSTPASTEPVEDAEDSQDRIDPTYQLLRLPGEEDEEFVLLRPFTVRGRRQLSSFLTAAPDGRLVSYTVQGETPNGPAVAGSAMQNDEGVARLRSFFRDSSPTFGNVLLVPIEDSILYVQSMYVTAGTDGQPRIQAVIVYYQTDPDSDENPVAVGATLQEALEELFGQAPDTLEETPDSDAPDIDDVVGGEETPDDDPSDPADPPEDTPDDPGGTDAELIAAIQAEFDAANAALTEGDLAAYQEHVQEAERLLDILATRQGAGGTGGGGTDEGGSGSGSGDGAASGGGSDPPAGGDGEDEGASAEGTTTTTTTPAGGQGRFGPSTTAPPTTASPPSSTTAPTSSSTPTTTRPSA
jgi:uncharacterized membrane protein (UPF0182 family)